MMNLTRYQPWSLLDRWHPEFEQLLRRKTEATEPAIGYGTNWTPAVDVQEETDRFLVRADVPGVEVKDIEISAEDGMLTIRGTRAAVVRSENDRVDYIERSSGTFMRRFTLPESANLDSIKAHCTNGVLEIEIPKQKRAEAKRIKVTVN